MAFASCQRGPAIYQRADTPREMADNAEKFAKETAKCAANYSDEDWKVAFDQFASMTKDYMEKKGRMSEADLFRADAARLQFTKTVAEKGNPELVKQMKELFQEMSH